MTVPIEIREAFHFLFLQHLFSVSDPSLYVLKGGVNLRFFFGSPRYSEDMDFDVLGGAVATLKKHGYKILGDLALKRAMQAFGVSDIEVNDPAKAKQTTTTQRFRLRLITEAGVDLPTKIEFSRRASDRFHVVKETIPGEVARRYRRLGFPCYHYSGDAAVVQKVRALAGRETPQSRDVFDLHILRLAGYPSQKLVDSEIDAATIRKATAAINELEFDAFSGQVFEFLEKEPRRLFGTPKAWEAIRLEVLELLKNG